MLVRMNVFSLQYSHSFYMIYFSSANHPPSSFCHPLVILHHLFVSPRSSAIISIFQSCYNYISLLYSAIHCSPYLTPSFAIYTIIPIIPLIHSSSPLISTSSSKSSLSITPWCYINVIDLTK